MTIYVDTSSAVHSKAGLGRYAANLRARCAPSSATGCASFRTASPPRALEGAAPAAGVRWGTAPGGLVLARQALRLPLTLLPGAALFTPPSTSCRPCAASPRC